MTPRERIKTAFAHKKPDRLPRYEIFFPAFSEVWRRRRGLPEDTDIYAHYPKIDIGAILASQEGPFLEMQTSREDETNRYVRDSWGRLARHSKTGKIFEVLETVVRKKSDLDRLEFRDPRTEERPDVEALGPSTEEVSERFAPVGGVMGLFMPSHYLRGETTFLMDLMDDAAFCHALIGRVGDFVTALGELILERTGTWDTALWVYDDFGSNLGPLMSPRMFETFFLPVYKEMISYWKTKGLRNVILHYDSNCWVILDILIDAGFTGIQGIYPGANMSIPAVKAKYGDRLTLVGGVCNITVLAPGPKEKIERTVWEIAEVARDGGVAIGAHSIEEDIAPEHYEYYVAALEEVDRGW